MTTAATTLFLTRHGETVWHEENRYTGVSDIALTPRGLEQAEALGAWAAGAGLDAIVTSPLSRARRTAEPAARATGIAPVVEPDLLEVDFGVAEGRTLGEPPRLPPPRGRRLPRRSRRPPLPLRRGPPLRCGPRRRGASAHPP